MERKQFGSVLVYFALLLIIVGLSLSYGSYELGDKMVGLGLILYGLALIITGALIVLFASNQEVELSYTYYGIFLVAGVIIGGLLSNADEFITPAFALIGLASAPLIAFFRSY